jgi:hypothetical protein
MRRNLDRRVQKLEAADGGDFKRGLQNLAGWLHIPPDRMAHAIRGREAELKTELDEDGSITWEGFLLVRDLLNLTSAKQNAAAVHRSGVESEMRTT